MIFENISFSDEFRAVWIPSSTDVFYLANDFHFLERCFFFKPATVCSSKRFELIFRQEEDSSETTINFTDDKFSLKSSIRTD